jgi:hypothetical protein
MTTNKAQGQSVDHVGLDLCTDVFAHNSSLLHFLDALPVSELKHFSRLMSVL